MDLEQTLKQGIALHDAGQLGDAARCYQAVLEEDPGNVDALYLMSVLASHAGELEMAVQLARQAIAGDARYFASHIALGNALQQLGELVGAEESFRRAIALNDRSAEASCNLASVLNAQGRFEDACDAAVRALMLRADFAEAQNNFGNALQGLGSAEEAIECYQKAVALNPDFADAWHNLGNARAEAGDGEGALEAHVRALQLADTPEREYDVGVAFLGVGQFESAARCFAQAIERKPDYLDAWINLSVALKDMGRLEEAEAVQRDAVQLAPDDAEAHFNLALVLLQQGKWREGWLEYEWRWRMDKFQGLRRDFRQPRWDGGAFDGKTLLVTAEQGFGDAIEFARFVPLAAARGGQVVLECRPGLERLMATLSGCAEVVTLGETLPRFDLHLPLMSLPAALGVDLETVPATVPYLAVPEGAGDFSDLAAAPGFKVGVVWAGKASRRDNALRSCTPDDLLPLLDVAGVRWFSLQVDGDGVGWPVGRAPLALAARLGDFADTAAAIASLDLVITVDTAVAHLAGALGKPVWVLLSRPCNAFLWMEDRVDSPWYPTARLFRQPEPGDWSGVVAELCASLSATVAGR